MQTPWLKDLVQWNKTHVASRLEDLRKHYCTGPCGQSSHALNTRSATDRTLKEAINIILELQEWRQKHD